MRINTSITIYKKLIVLIAATLISGSVFAFSYPEWNSAGRVISSKDLINTLLYIYGRLPSPVSCTNGSIVNWNQSTGKYECVSCANNQYLVRQSNSWGCADTLSYGSNVGCKLRYRIKSSVATSTWAETNWGGLNGSDWEYGPAVGVTGNKTTLAFEVSSMCLNGTSFDLGLRYRGNSGPYWNTNIGSHYADVVVSSGTSTWGTSQFTDPFSKSCNVKGGDGTCGFLIQEKNELGSIKCDTMLIYTGGNNDTTYGFQTDKYGASTGQGSCPADGCKIQMAIRCYDPSTFSCSNPDTILANGTSLHTVSDCQSAGGTAFDTGNGCACKFTASSCPSGWSMYENWSETQATTCNGTGDPQCSSSCTTGSHTFANKAIETCYYRSGSYTGEPWPNNCTGGGGTCYATASILGCK